MKITLLLPLLFTLGCQELPRATQATDYTPACTERNAYVQCLNYFLIDVRPDENFNPDGSIRTLVDSMRYCSDLTGFRVNLEHTTINLTCEK